jgi:hypothetical protein
MAKGPHRIRETVLSTGLLDQQLTNMRVSLGRLRAHRSLDIPAARKNARPA